MAMAVRNRLELQQERERGHAGRDRIGAGPVEPPGLARACSAPSSRARATCSAPTSRGCRSTTPSAASSTCWWPTARCRADPSSMVARRDRGVVSVVMSSRLPFTTPDYLHDKRFAHDPKLDDTFREEGIAALVGVPLIWDGEVIGLLFVADRYHRMHTAQSISILCTLATHGAVALKNARDFERANAALAQADAGARRAGAAPAQHPGRRRRARADDLAAGAGRLAGHAVRVGRAAARRQRAGAGRGGAGGEPRHGARATAATGAQHYAPHGERSAELRRALRLSRQTGRSVVAYRGERRVVPGDAGDRRRRHARLGRCSSTAASSTRWRCAPSSAAPASSASCCCRRSAWRRPRAAACRRCCARWCRRARTSPRCWPTAPSATVVDLAQPLSLMLVEMDGPSAGYAARRFRSLRAAGRRAGRRHRRRARRPVQRHRAPDAPGVVASGLRSEIGAPCTAV